jgi:HK97 family phage prohead protease
MDLKSFPMKLGQIDDAGSFTGWASVYNNVDQGGDAVQRGAFTKSIQSQGRGITLLWQHRAAEPIGLGRVSDQEKGLQVEGQLLLSDPIAERAYQHLRAGTVKGLSIGYDTVKASPASGGGRLLQELKLWEVSLVTFPMNTATVVDSIKSLHDAERLLCSLRKEDLEKAETLNQLQPSKLN